jgi:hypothetical protein
MSRRMKLWFHSCRSSVALCRVSPLVEVVVDDWFTEINSTLSRD